MGCWFFCAAYLRAVMRIGDKALEIRAELLVLAYSQKPLGLRVGLRVLPWMSVCIALP